MAEDRSILKTLLWNFTQPRYDTWEHGQVMVQSEKPFRLEIKAIRNRLREGFVAIDDFKYVLHSVEK